MVIHFDNLLFTELVILGLIIASGVDETLSIIWMYFQNNLSVFSVYIWVYFQYNLGLFFLFG